MRLLNTTTIRLELFNRNIPKYAILSHMWGRDEDEVLFKHIEGSDEDRRLGKLRKGYAKVKDACERARIDDWKYIWIDTCCIDKDSSAELSEAINSMFQWYWDSGVCYAYLEDVASDKSPPGTKRGIFDIVQFERSRWFTRGWTLQELVAPRNVTFYNCDWENIGTKATLRDAISKRTHIRPEMVVNYNYRETSIAERLSWAAERQTTKAEDRAYCLMGLVGVNMPLLYGEGDAAFRRLQEGIIKISHDHTIFAWKAFLTFEGVDETRGMIAFSQEDFKDASNIVQIDGKEPYSAYTMTNIGLQIELPLLPLDPNEDSKDMELDGSENFYRAILNCTYKGNGPKRWVTIYLKKVSEGHYVRRRPGVCGETRINPRQVTATQMIVTQDEVGLPWRPFKDTWEIKLRNAILYTKSGFTFEGRNLEGGYINRTSPFKGTNPEILVFDRKNEHFGIVVGHDNGIPWLDVLTGINPADIEKLKSSYHPGGSRHNIIAQYRNGITIKVSEDRSVVVQVEVIGSKDDVNSTLFRVTSRILSLSDPQNS